jgi:hypothetical protein
MVCLRYIIVNTLHKGGGGGGDDDDDDNIRLDQKFQLFPGQLSATEWQTSTLMSTAHIICKLLG